MGGGGKENQGGGGGGGGGGRKQSKGKRRERAVKKEGQRGREREMRDHRLKIKSQHGLYGSCKMYAITHVRKNQIPCEAMDTMKLPALTRNMAM